MARPGRKKGTPKTGGRKPGSRNKATKAEIGRATGAEIGNLSDLAKRHTADAIDALVRICTKGLSEAAVVSAAVALLDRGYGRPVQALEHAGELKVTTADARGKLAHILNLGPAAGAATEDTRITH